MKLPKLDLAKLPQLDKLTGLYGSAAYTVYTLAADDTTIAMMVYVYDRAANK